MRRYRDNGYAGPRTTPDPHMTKNDELLNTLRDIGLGPGNLEMRLQAAESAIQDQRSRFPTSAAGQIQWKWYLRQLAADIGLERSKLIYSARRRTKPGAPPTEPIVELLDCLGPHILRLNESPDGQWELANVG
jgi:hypothetical protein